VTTCFDVDTLRRRAANGELRWSGHAYPRNLDTEIVMKYSIVKLGAASKVTKDFTGNWAWDGLVYDYRTRRWWG
jgi:hypothetical protein